MTINSRKIENSLDINQQNYTISSAHGKVRAIFIRLFNVFDNDSNFKTKRYITYLLNRFCKNRTRSLTTPL